MSSDCFSAPALAAAAECGAAGSLLRPLPRLVLSEVPAGAEGGEESAWTAASEAQQVIMASD